MDRRAVDAQSPSTDNFCIDSALVLTSTSSSTIFTGCFFFSRNFALGTSSRGIRVCRDRQTIDRDNFSRVRILGIMNESSSPDFAHSIPIAGRPSNDEGFGIFLEFYLFRAPSCVTVSTPARVSFVVSLSSRQFCNTRNNLIIVNGDCTRRSFARRIESRLFALGCSTFCPINSVILHLARGAVSPARLWTTR